MVFREVRRAIGTRGRRSFLGAAMLAALFGSLGCGSDSSTSPQTSFTPADQLAVAGQIVVPAAITVALLTPDLSSAAVSGPRVVAASVTGATTAAAAVAALTVPVDRTVSCAAGGTARTTGTLTGSLAAGGSGSLTIALSSVLSNCGVTSDGRTLLLTADPGLAIAGSYVVNNRVPADPQTLTIAGTMSIAVSGSRIQAIPCEVNLAFTTSASTHTSSLTGTVCGGAVSRQLTWSP